MAQEDQKIDYVEFHAADFDAVQKFYEAAFGWTFVDYGPEYRAFNDGKLDGGFRRSNARRWLTFRRARPILPPLAKAGSCSKPHGSTSLPPSAVATT